MEKYFYIERINTFDGRLNGHYTQKAENLDKVLWVFDETESDGGLYEPRVAEITEAEYKECPYFYPARNQWVYELKEEE